METKNQYLKPIIIILLLIAAAGAILWFFSFKRFKPADNLISFKAAIAELDYSFKLLEYPFSENQSESMAGKIIRANRAWQIFIENFSDIQPPEFLLSRDWQKKITTIEEYIKKSDQLIKEKKDDEARAEIEKAYDIFFQIKKENGIKNMFAETLLFLKAGQKAGLAANKEEAVANLSDLKIIFTGLKERVNEENYHRLMAGLEQAILDIERLLPGPDFKKAQKNLLAGAEKLYWQY